MTTEKTYNPLDKRNLAASVADAILKRPPSPLPPAESFLGAGLYAIYYAGKSFTPYEAIGKANRNQKLRWPIYVGKAVPEGARKGGLGLSENVGAVLWKRLEEHAKSIRLAKNLDIEDFCCRYMVVDDIWIPLGEALLIERFKPLWNMCIDGFGNHDPGSGRYQQKRSPWDVLHPGRAWADRCAQNPRSEAEILKDVASKIAEHVTSMDGDGTV